MNSLIVLFITMLGAQFVYAVPDQEISKTCISGGLSATFTQTQNPPSTTITVTHVASGEVQTMTADTAGRGLAVNIRGRRALVGRNDNDPSTCTLSLAIPIRAAAPAATSQNPEPSSQHPSNTDE